jgi:hypothetical protein
MKRQQLFENYNLPDDNNHLEESFENISDWQDLSVMRMFGSNHVKHAEKYFRKTLKKASKGKASSNDVQRARRALKSVSEKRRK